MRRPVVMGRACGILAGLALVACPPALATLGPPQLVSVSDREQADRAGAPALSADGRSVAFEATLGGVQGVFRRDRSTGALALVAGGGSGSDAAAPSISGDGRFVSLTTVAPLDPVHDVNGARDVYVRDMDAPGGACRAGAPCGFMLASARDGVADGLAYAPGSGPGSRAAGGVALSADGRRVAFVVEGASDLAGPGTPGGQVAVRDLDTLRTTLVSVARDRVTGATTDRAVPGSAVTASTPTGGTRAPGAALSADGTTVAWLGGHVPDQVPTLRDERAAMDTFDAAPFGYDEPLWRRIAGGPAAPTRRIVGGGDPLASGCPADGTLAVEACRGPFPSLADVRERGSAGPRGWLDLPDFAAGLPRLSADGRTVALLGNPTEDAELFSVDMRDGLSRSAAVRQVTHVPPFRFPTELGGGAYGDVVDLGLSPDGRWAGVVTDRTPFLPPPNLVGAPLTSSGLPELYRLDLAADTIERVTVPPAGGPSGPNGGNVGDLGARAPSFSGDGRTMVFSSTAANLAAGDANGAADVFAVVDAVVADDPGSWTIAPAPPATPTAPEWRMAVGVTSRPDGTVRLDAVAPGAGTVRATVRATVPVTRTVRVRRTVRRVGRTVTRLVTRHRITFVARQVATAKVTARTDGPVAASLRLAAPYRALAKRSRGLRGTVTVRFTAAARPALTDALAATFRVRAPKHTTPTTSGAPPR